MPNFDEIILTRSERFLLFKLRIMKRIPESSLKESDHILFSYGLIKKNPSGQKNVIGEQLTDGTCSLTDLYRRYRSYRREVFRKSFVYPMIVAFFTALITALSTVLLSQRLGL